MKYFSTIQRILLILIGMSLSSCSVAHPGRLNAEGCHNNKKTGEYHCHRSTEKTNTVKQADQTDIAQQEVALLGAGTEKRTRQENIIQLDYEGFTVWVDCTKRGPTKFRYTAQHDSGNSKRYDNLSSG